MRPGKVEAEVESRTLLVGFDCPGSFVEALDRPDNFVLEACFLDIQAGEYPGMAVSSGPGSDLESGMGYALAARYLMRGTHCRSLVEPRMS